MANPVVQFQVLSSTPEKTAQFYSALFGWSVTADNPLGCMQINTGSEAGIQGGIWPAPPESPNFVQLFVAVEAVSTSLNKAQELGATVLVPATILPEGDEMAVVLDPQGLSFAIVKTAEIKKP